MRTRTCIGLVLAAALLPSAPHAADEIHWTITGPNSVSFDWRGADTTLCYGLTTSYGDTAKAVTPTPLPFSSAGPFREARLAGLAAGAIYHYSIGTGADHTFHTAPARGSSGFAIYAEGDIGNSTDWPRMGVVQDMIAAGHPAFVLCVGDLTYGNTNGQRAVDAHFNDVMRWSLDAAYMPAWGNHEWEKPSADNLGNYKGRLDLPNPQASPSAPTVDCCGEDWSWFDYGNVRFIAYPEPYSGSTWSDWATQAGPLMDQAQNDPAITFIVTYGHRPAYSSGWHSGDPGLASILNHLGATHTKYKLNINGHSHDYERSYPQSGVTHLTVGVGGSSLEEHSGNCLWNGGCPPPSWSAYRAMHHAAVQLRFTATSIQCTAFCGPPGDSGPNRNDVTCTQGSVLDSFEISNVAAGVDPSLSGIALSEPIPNPSRAAVSFALTLPRTAHVQWGVFDLSGRRLGGGEAWHPAGLSFVNWTADLAPGSSAAGVRYLRVAVEGRTFSRRFVVL
jgi:hypothetical protein